MIKKHLILVIFIGLLVVATLFINNHSVSAQTTTTQSEVTAQDLGIAEPILLPSSPFYFFKNWGQSIRLFLTFNPVKKAELQLKYTAEKAIEVKKLENNKEALTKALNNYSEARKKLEERFKKLENSSQNPNVSQLLDKFIEQNTKHQKLFEDLINRADKILKQNMENIKEKIAEQNVNLPLKFEAAARVSERLNKILDKTTKGEFQNLQKILKYEDLIEATQNEELKEQLRKVKEIANENLKTELENQKIAQERFKEVVEQINKIKPIPLVILEELKTKITIPKVQSAINEIQEKILEKIIENKMEIAPRAAELIKKAEELINELKTNFENKKTKLQDTEIRHIQNLIDLSSKHLEMAKNDYSNEKYESAYGRSNSSMVIIRSGIRYLDKSSEPTEEKTQLRTQVPPIPPLPLFERKIEILKKAQQQTKEAKETQVICTLEYAPVCGKNNKTYSNKCFAKADGVEIAYEGECGKSINQNLPPTELTPEENVFTKTKIESTQ